MVGGIGRESSTKGANINSLKCCYTLISASPRPRVSASIIWSKRLGNRSEWVTPDRILESDKFSHTPPLVDVGESAQLCFNSTEIILVS